MPTLEHKIPTPNEDALIYQQCQRRLEELRRELRQASLKYTGECRGKARRDSLRSFIWGITVMNLFPRTVCSVPVQQPDDDSAILSDWKHVGADLYAAILAYADELERSHGQPSRAGASRNQEPRPEDR